MHRLIKNFWAMFVVSAAVLLVGMYSFWKLPVALYPNTNKPEVRVYLPFLGLTADEFWQMHGMDLSQSLQVLQGIEKAEAEVFGQSCQFHLQFDWGIDPDTAKEKVESVVRAAESAFPREWPHASVFFAKGEGSMFFVALDSPTVDKSQIARALDAQLLPELRAIEGVQNVFFTEDASSRSYTLSLDPLKLLNFNLTFHEVRESLQRLGTDAGLGELLLKDGKRIPLVLHRRVLSKAEFEQAIVARRNNLPVRVIDLGSVDELKSEDARKYLVDGKPTLLVGGQPKPDANIKEVSEKFLATVRQQAKQIVPDIQVHEILNPSVFIRESVQNVFSELFAGVLITTLTIFLFLGSLSQTLVISLAMPLSLFAGFLLMELLRIEVNLVSMGAMALSVGMVVDGATVVLENISRHFSEKKVASSATSFSFNQKLDIVVAALKEVILPVTTSILTTVIVFLPLPFASPIAAAVLGDLAVVMVCVMLCSLVITLTVIPSLFLFATEHFSRLSLWMRGRVSLLYILQARFETFFIQTREVYLKILRLFLYSRKHQNILLYSSVFLLVAAIYLLAFRVKHEILARPLSDKVFLGIDFKDKSLNPDEREAKVRLIGEKVKQNFSKEIKYTLSRSETNWSWVMLFLRDKEQMNKVKSKLRTEFPNAPDTSYFIEDWTPSSLEIPTPADLAIKVLATDQVESVGIMKQLQEYFDAKAEFGQKSYNPFVREASELTLRLKEEKVLAAEKVLQNEFGGSQNVTAELLENVRGLTSEVPLFDFEHGGVENHMHLSFPKHYFQSEDQLRNVPVKLGSRAFYLGDFIDFSIGPVKPEDFYVNGRREYQVKLWRSEGFTGDIHATLGEIKAKLARDLGVEPSKIAYFDDGVEVRNNIESLLVCLAYGLLLILVVLAVQFASANLTFIALAAIPLGVIGSGLAIWSFGSTLGLNSMLGLILLAGTAVNNSIIFIDFTESFLENKVRDLASMQAAVLAAASVRLRPILITTLTTILGMLPIAFALGSGGEILQPLGLAVSGGLGVSTLMTLFVVPVLIVRMAANKRIKDAK